MEKTGGPLSKTEPVFALSRQFENALDPTLAAAEAGLPLDDFLSQLRSSARLLDSLASLLLPDGTVKRDTFVSAFPRMISDLRLGRWLAPSVKSSVASTPNASFDPLPVGSIWRGPSGERLIVRERNGDRFTARLAFPGDAIIREISGTVRGDTMEWHAADVIAVKGARGGDNIGTIKGDQIDLRWGPPNGPKNGFSVLGRETGRGGNAFQRGTVWHASLGGSVFTVTSRDSNSFQARFEAGNGSWLRHISGTISDDRLFWYRRDVKALRGGPGGDNFGVIRGNEIQVDFFDPGKVGTGTFALRRK